MGTVGRFRGPLARGALSAFVVLAVASAVAPGAGASTRGRLSAARARVAALAREITAARSTLTSLDAQISAEQARIDGVQADLNAVASRIETSRCCPSPVDRRCHTAHRTPNDAMMPATSYANAPGTSSGGLPTTPDLKISPAMPQITGSVASKSRYGPDWPKSVIDAATRCGNRADTDSGSNPIGPSWPGRVVSIQTSACPKRPRSRARPSGVARSTTAPRLLKLRMAK